MSKKLVIIGAFFGGTGVMLGALGAHALKDLLNPALLNSFETGVRYQIVHALLLIIIGIQNKIPSKIIGLCLIVGTILFSFSIYLLSIRELIGLPGLSFLGPITPIGGLLLIAAWTILLVKAIKLKEA